VHASKAKSGIHRLLLIGRLLFSHFLKAGLLHMYWLIRKTDAMALKVPVSCFFPQVLLLRTMVSHMV